MSITDFLCNSSAFFMRIIVSGFGNLNESESLLYYLDDLHVFAASEEEALKRLDIVFSHLRANNLKLAQNTCHFLQRSVIFLVMRLTAVAFQSIRRR